MAEKDSNASQVTQPVTLPVQSEGKGGTTQHAPQPEVNTQNQAPPANGNDKLFTIGSTEKKRPDYETQKSYGSVTFADTHDEVEFDDGGGGCCSRCFKRIFPYGFKSELKELWILAWPMVLVCLANMMIPFTAVLFCGHLGTEELDAVSLANSLINVTGLSVGMGLATACDTLFSQTYGSANKKRVGIYLQKAILILILFCFPCWAIHLNTESILLIFGQNVDVARLAGNYILYFMPGLFFNFMFQALTKFINNQNIVIPSVLIGLLANGVNVLAHYIFINVIGWGTTGSAVAQVLAYFIMAMGTLCYILFSKMYTETWDGWTKECLDDWGFFMKLALPGMLMVCLEWWCFEIGTVLTGVLSKTELGAQSIMFQLETISYVIPVGIAIAVSIRVGQFLGSNDPRGAKTTARVSLLIIWISAIIVGALYAGLRWYLPRAFSGDPDVIKRTAAILPILSIFQLFDGIAGVCGGVLRGCGRQVVGAVVIFIGYYILALPVGIPLMFLTPLGIEGLWWGYAGGIFVEAVAFFLLVQTTNWELECENAQLRAGITDEDGMIQDEDDEDLDEKTSLIPPPKATPRTKVGGNRRYSSPVIVGSSIPRRYSSSKIVTTLHGRRFSTPGKPKSMPLYPRRYSSPYLAQYQDAIEDRDQMSPTTTNIIRSLVCLLLCIAILVGGLMVRLYVHVPITQLPMCIPTNSTSNVTLPPCTNVSSVALAEHNLQLFQASSWRVR
ncbi:unnamed protein product [Owenia fusiformis]|uniref:Multidrug and toxin extrusion protein n=1 Tax=Owenia fusiformis TaxID=6347 RepID=A0A8S4N8W1_OWEFU|nr:unnamed protein product [Owenia fusiformis]